MIFSMKSFNGGESYMGEPLKASHTEWFKRAEEDMLVTRHLLIEGMGHLTAAALLQQAVERYLKGYLLSKGWRLKKTHDLEYLITEAIARDNAFDPYLDIRRRLTEYYLETRYPPIVMSDLTLDEVKSSLKEAEQLVSLIITKTSP